MDKDELKSAFREALDEHLGVDGHRRDHDLIREYFTPERVRTHEAHHRFIGTINGIAEAWGGLLVKVVFWIIFGALVLVLSKVAIPGFPKVGP